MRMFLFCSINDIFTFCYNVIWLGSLMSVTKPGLSDVMRLDMRHTSNCSFGMDLHLLLDDLIMQQARLIILLGTLEHPGLRITA